MEKLIETLGSLCIYLGNTTIKRLEDRFIVDSNYNYNDGYYQYDVCYYDFVDAEVDLDGNILSASRRYGQDFWNGGGEMSEEKSYKFGDPDWEPINDENIMGLVSNRAEEILSLKPGEEITITRQDCCNYNNRNVSKEV